MKPQIRLRLFVSANSLSAARALENLKSVCDDPRVSRKYDIELEVVDINESPDAAEEDKVLVTPTLLRKLPLPIRRVVGDLSNRQDIYITLDIESPPSSPSRTRDESSA